MSVCLDSQHVVVTAQAGRFALHSLDTGALVREFDNGSQDAAGVILPHAFIHHDRALITGSTNGFVHLWDVEEGYIFSSLKHRDDCESAIRRRSRF